MKAVQYAQKNGFIKKINFFFIFLFNMENNYFNLYMKYKRKYLKLKQSGNGIDDIKIFFSSNFYIASLGPNNNFFFKNDVFVPIELMDVKDITFNKNNDDYIEIIILNNKGEIYQLKGSEIYSTLTTNNLLSTPRKVESISSSYNHIIIKLDNSDIYTKGNNTYGQLGVGDEINRDEFTIIKTKDTSIVDKIYAGNNHTIYCYNNNNSIYVCGDNRFGQIALGPTQKVNQFTLLRDLPENIINIFFGQNNIALVTDDNSIYFCGSNTYHQLGLISKKFCKKVFYNEFTKLNLNLNLGLIKKILLCESFTFILTENNLYHCGQYVISSKSTNIFNIYSIPNLIGIDPTSIDIFAKDNSFLMLYKKNGLLSIYDSQKKDVSLKYMLDDKLYYALTNGYFNYANKLESDIKISGKKNLDTEIKETREKILNGIQYGQDCILKGPIQNFGACWLHAGLVGILLTDESLYLRKYFTNASNIKKILNNKLENKQKYYQLDYEINYDLINEKTINLKNIFYIWNILISAYGGIIESENDPRMNCKNQLFRQQSNNEEVTTFPKYDGYGQSFWHIIILLNNLINIIQHNKGFYRYIYWDKIYIPPVFSPSDQYQSCNYYQEECDDCSRCSDGSDPWYHHYLSQEYEEEHEEEHEEEEHKEEEYEEEEYVEEEYVEEDYEEEEEWDQEDDSFKSSSIKEFFDKSWQEYNRRLILIYQLGNNNNPQNKIKLVREKINQKKNWELGSIIILFNCGCNDHYITLLKCNGEEYYYDNENNEGKFIKFNWDKKITEIKDRMYYVSFLIFNSEKMKKFGRIT